MGDAAVRASRISVVGAGPAGLLLARTVRRRVPGATVEVHERLGPGEAQGFGVSLSDRTMHRLAADDPVIHQRIVEAGVVQRGIDVRLPSGSVRYDGFEVLAVARGALLDILRTGAEEEGAHLHYGSHRLPGAPAGDVVAIADGAASSHRDARREAFGTTTRNGRARYIWLGTTADPGDAAVMAFAGSAAGPMALHLYAYGGGMSTAVVEMDDRTWRTAGLDRAVRAGGEIDDWALGFLADVFAAPLGGHPLISARSRWRRFTVVHNERWSYGRSVLLGDAAHTAHFTVGSGTRLALEDALELGTALGAMDVPAALRTYERHRRPAVARTQRWADASMRWWETYGRRLHLAPQQFGLHFLTRTPAMTWSALQRRCPDRLTEAADAFRAAAGAPPSDADPVCTPLTVAGVRLPGRCAVPARPGPPPASGYLRPDGTGVRLDEGSEGAPPQVSYAALPCPERDDEATGAELLQRVTAAQAVLVVADLERPGWWWCALRRASRLREDTGVVTGVLVPSGWQEHVPAEPGIDSWRQRIALALISGRVDFVVCLPMTAAQEARSTEEE